MQKKCTGTCLGSQCHKGKYPKVKAHQEHPDFEKKSAPWADCLRIVSRYLHFSAYFGQRCSKDIGWSLYRDERKTSP